MEMVNTGVQSQNIGSDYGYILILPQTLQLCVRKDRQEKQYAEGTGGIILGTGEGDSTDDLQRIGEIYCKLCNTFSQYFYNMKPMAITSPIWFEMYVNL